MIIEAVFDLGKVGPCALKATLVFDSITNQVKFVETVDLWFSNKPFLENDIIATRERTNSTRNIDGCDFLDLIGHYNKKGYLHDVIVTE